MTCENQPAGLAEVERAKADGRWEAAYAGTATMEVPADLIAALDAEPGARAMFDILTSQNRYAILHRLHAIKRAETRARRVEAFVTRLARGETPYPQKRALGRLNRGYQRRHDDAVRGWKAPGTRRPTRRSMTTAPVPRSNPVSASTDTKGREMVVTEPVGELDARYSGADAVPTGWTEAFGRLRDAELYWLSTVRPDGRPHVTPLLSVWLDGALFFCTGPEERKAKNLARNPHCILTTGCNVDDGLDLVVEGSAANVRDDAKLQRIADAYVSKYGNDWRFTVRDGAFRHEAGKALVYEVVPSTAFGFGKGTTYSQTRWRF